MTAQSLAAVLARRIQSLRARAFLVVLAVLVTPIAFASASRFFEVGLGETMLFEVRAGAAETREVIKAAGADPDMAALAAAVDRIAERHKVRIRVVEPGGRVEVDVDHEASRGALWHTATRIWYGANAVPSLRAFDATLGPLPGRAEVGEARARGSSADCRTAAGAEQVVCHAVVKVTGDGTAPDRIVYVQDSSPRSIGAFQDLSGGLVRLTLLILPVALVLGWWLGWRVVRPIEQLRGELLARAAVAAPGAGIELKSGDEFGDLATAFNALLAALHERAKANEGFVADLAHEFKNPVAAIRACSEALSDGNVDQTKAARVAGVLRDSSRRLDILLTQFLDLARAEAGMPQEVRGALDLDELLRGIVASMRGDERWAGVKLEVFPSGDAKVTGVSGRLESAFRNVLENAASFAAPTGTVEVRLRAERDFVRVVIKDDGPGILPDDLPRVFDRFFTTRRSERGTGLGLALVRAVVEAHGGTVRALSDGPGKGASFELKVPRVAKPASRPRPDTAKVPAHVPRNATSGIGPEAAA